MGRQLTKRKPFEVIVEEKADLWQYDSVEAALRASLPYLVDLLLNKKCIDDEPCQAGDQSETIPLPDDQTTASHDAG